MNTKSALRCLVGSLLVALIGLAGARPADAGEGVGHLVETLAVDASDGDGTWTGQPLFEGLHYELEVAGTFTYGQGDSRADAECSQLEPDPGWQRNRYVAMTSYQDLLDLYLDNSAVEWVPTERDAFGCNTFNHTYRFRFTMPETRHIRLYLRDIDGSYVENAGVLMVRLSQVEAAPEPEAAAPEPSSDPPAAEGAAATAPVAALSPPAPSAPSLRGHSAPDLSRPDRAVDDQTVPVNELAVGPDPAALGLVPVGPPPPSPLAELATMLAVMALTAVASSAARRLRDFSVLVTPRR